MLRIFFLMIMLLAGASTPASAFSLNQGHRFSSGPVRLSAPEVESLDSLLAEENLLSPQDRLLIAENRRAVAIILNLSLGMLGVHRLYLGTKPWVPAVYLFTFGGGFFVLPFIDLVCLLVSRDISKFENNPRVLMWLPEKVFNQEGN
jgi:TM2 domain-containing membrane protein YozV